MAKVEKGKAPDYILLLSVLALLGIGLIMVHSSSSVATMSDWGDSFYYLRRQAMWAGVGLAVMVFMVGFPYQWIRKYAVHILAGSILLLILVLVPGIGKVVNGARRWIDLGPVGFQPSELNKLALIIFTAAGLAYNRNRIQRITTLSPYVLITLLCMGLILKQPDLGTALAIGGTAFVLWFSAGAHFLHLGGMVLAAIPALYYAIFSEDYRRARFLSFLNPWADPLGDGYHIIQSLLALGSGGFFGKGLGNSRQKLFYLPERHTDFIFAILGEELGLAGALLVVLLFALFAFRGYRIAVTAPDTFSSLLATGLTTMIVLQAVINIGVVTGSIPITGITLPFVSYGGSSLIPSMMGIGMLLNISRYCRTSNMKV
jgi:cell division protein FtsW